MKNILCIIPARGGSKRLPRKNVRLLSGKPLMAYSIEAALEAEVFDDVVVSSDDEAILNLAISCGAWADRRPAHLAEDAVRMVQVVDEYLSRPEMQDAYQHVAVMLPTCPFRTAADVRKGIEKYHAHERPASLIAVTPYDFPPQLALDLSDDGQSLSMRDPSQYGRTTRSQDIGTAYHPNGALYVTTVARFLYEKTFFGDPLIGYVMPPERSLDIDYPYQFLMAESLMTSLLEPELSW